MYGTVLGAFIVLSALGIWHLLKRTRLKLPARIALAAVFSHWLLLCWFGSAFVPASCCIR